MGNTPSANTHTDLYEQYLNEQKRIIAAQQEQINNLSRMNYQNNTVNQPHNIPANVYIQSMPIQRPQTTYSNDAKYQQPPSDVPRIENGNIRDPGKGKLNPYKILGITKKYDEKSLKKAYLKKALISHPDRGGSPVEFQQVSIAYTLLLKKLKDKNNNHEHNDLRNNSQSYMSGQQSDNIRNVNMSEQFDVNMFNKIYEDNKEDTVYDRGYGDWMKEDNGQKMLQQPKMFNKSFNKDLFNHEFEKYKVSQQKKMGGELVNYEEPQVDISMRGKDSLMLLGQEKVSDFSGTSEGGLTFRDYKDAFTNSCLIDESSVDINNRSDNINSMKSSRTNINYKIKADLKIFIPLFIKKIQDLNYVSTKEHNKYLKWCKEKVIEYPVVLPEYANKKNKKINPYVFIDNLFDLLNKDDVVITGNGSACVMTFQAAKIKQGQRLYTNSGSASMGYDLPASIGAAIAMKGKRVICLAGDGSLMMNLQELQTMKGYNLPIKVFILNNDGYVSIKQTQEAYFSDNVTGVGPESGVTMPNFTELGKALNIPSMKITKLSELSSTTFKKMLNNDKPGIFEIVIDPSQGFSPKLTSRKLSDGTMVSPSLHDMSPFLDEDELAKNII